MALSAAIGTAPWHCSGASCDGGGGESPSRPLNAALSSDCPLPSPLEPLRQLGGALLSLLHRCPQCRVADPLGAAGLLMRQRAKSTRTGFEFVVGEPRHARIVAPPGA